MNCFKDNMYIITSRATYMCACFSLLLEIYLVFRAHISFPDASNIRRCSELCCLTVTSRSRSKRGQK